MCAKNNGRYKLGFSVLLVLSALLMGQGCPGPGPGTNQNPAANAGADQNVNGGSVVILNGSASSDPDGDTLSFAWTQTTGTAVALSGATTAGPSFTAPNTTETLSFQLTVSDGKGGSDSDTVNVNVTAGAGNQPPIANAGTDQSVLSGDLVSLNGSGSSDPDGDPLSFSWTQIAGTAVALSGANSATPSFTAPAVTETLTFQLTVNDGAISASDTVDVSVTVAAAPVLLVANFTGNNIVGYDISSPDNINGNIAPDANLAGAQTLLIAPSDIVVDSAGALLVSNFVGNSLTSYPNAADLTGINGNIAPTRNVQGAATLLVNPVSLAINTANDLVFVALGAGGTVHVYANASSATLNGNLPPTRTITSANINTPRGINFGANDNLYVANAVGNTVSVFANASNLNGAVAATRVITSAVFAGLFDVYVDANDTMFVVNSAGGGNRIHIFNNAATRNGAQTPDFTLTVTGAVNITAIAVDSAGNGYIVDNGANRVYQYDNIATRNGTLPPDRTLAGASTQLLGPIRVFLLE